jgi:hypothetical protein
MLQPVFPLSVFVTLAKSYPLFFTLKKSRLIPALCSLLTFVKIKCDNGWKSAWRTVN